MELKNQLLQSYNLHKPLVPNLRFSAETRWKQKPVLATCSIALCGSAQMPRLEGPGSLKIEKGNGVQGGDCLRLEYNAVQPVQNPSGRAYTTTEMILPFDHEDFSAFNRISLWIYLDSHGSVYNEMTLTMHNEGPKVMPVPGRFEGYHTQTIEAGKWTNVLWEMPRVCRSNVTAITVSLQATGSAYPSSPRIVVLLDDLRLEAVDADSDKGFALRKGTIAYCHSGYRKNGAKHALVQHCEGNFRLINELGATVFEGAAQAKQDGFSLLDFSSFQTEGEYKLQIGELSTNPFLIGSKAYLAAAWKTLNFFFTERCGCSVPSVHAECHLDVVSVHPDGRKRSVAGGWHDAGDLTQDGRNTAECILGMLAMARAAKGQQPELYARTLEEVRWGLDWLLRIRWGDGYRHCGRIIGFWTDNTFGTTDDLQTTAENRPYDNLLSAQVLAEASVLLREEDAAYAHMCECCAAEDYLFGVEWMHNPIASFSSTTPLQLNAQAALSAVELYKTLEDKRYLDDAVQFVRYLMRSQCMQVPESFSIPLRGFFYESEAKERVQVYFHRSYEHVTVQAITSLLQAYPSHADASLWRESCEAYASYLEQIYRITPYGVFPTGIYEVDNTNLANLYQEGDKTKGAPSLEEYNRQVRNGFRLDATHYLRTFPVAYQFRGFHAPILSKALAALELEQVLLGTSLRQHAVRQLEWILGYNPFACSTVYGEGYDYHPLYNGLLPQIVGAVPVGIETYEDEDEPYYPIQNLPTYKEIWGHTTCRLMKCIAYLGFEK